MRYQGVIFGDYHFSDITSKANKQVSNIDLYADCSKCNCKNEDGFCDGKGCESTNLGVV